MDIRKRHVSLIKKNPMNETIFKKYYGFFLMREINVCYYFKIIVKKLIIKSATKLVFSGKITKKSVVADISTVIILK